ncbi:calcium-binding protein [Cereibacter changlensis]|uniref:calcium-binding protein n=1 Tax=Cereibacter changlensis TaxID=402884 RepID=UPI003D158FAD
MIAGGAGADVLLGEGGDDALNGDDGDDLIEGGAGDDGLFGGAGDDTFLAQEGDGRDLIFGGEGSDTIDLGALLTAAEIDLGSLSAIGWVKSGGVIDRLVGVENAIGGGGDDLFRAGTAANTMAGGEGDDIFRFDTAAAAEGDMILDFSPGDMIDLSGIDAMRGTGGNQSFRLAAADEAPVAGLLVLTEGDGDTTLVSGHTDDDGQADFTLTVQGRQSLGADSFTL